jgi:putative PIN family toxin of toxin-antitoxin system
MKVFFDTNVYIADALLGKAARRIIKATEQARWRIYASRYLLDEIAHVLVDDLHFSRRLAGLAQRRIVRLCSIVESAAVAYVPHDPKDSPILQGALASGADYLVTNDRHLLVLHPFKGLQIISMNRYFDLLREHGKLR